ncbi:MAG: hypothetical protein HW416_3898, partial [Chloroflexi bacterium]|nr:hypothetical protein [Chloroflexota bacterium]
MPSVVGCTLPWMALALMLGCAVAPARAPGQAPGPAASPADGASKTLVLGQQNVPKLLGMWEFSSTNGGGASLVEIHTTGLTTLDARGNPIGRLAVGIPSGDDGSLAFLPDGRVRTIWRLRPNVTWHDGAPFTADDVIFSPSVFAPTEIRPSNIGAMQYIERIEAIDPLTILITWKSTYYAALNLDHRGLWLFPKHILAEPLDGDKEAFLSHPYFTSGYVHLGPFRLVDWGLGQEMVFERYDGYFLGRPKVGRIIVKAVQDANTMLAYLRAGALDLAAEKALPINMSLDVRDEWQATRDGSVFQRPDNWLYVWMQFDPQFARHPEVGQDVRLRRGMYVATDRDAVRDFLMPGVPGASGDTFMNAGDPRAPIVGEPFAVYRYDPNRALQDLADGGWRRAADGRMLNAAGEPVQIELRSPPGPQTGAISLIAADWRRIGLDVTEFIPPPQISRDNELQAKFPGFELRGRGQNEGVFSSFDGREMSTAATRWLGANRSHYANPALDRLSDRLYTT